MQFSNYADFRGRVQTLLDGDDISDSDLSGSVMDTLIGLGEVRIYRDVRSTVQDVPLSIVVTNNVAIFPDDYLELKGAPFIPGYKTSTYVPWEEIQNYIQTGARQSTHPCLYSYEGDTLIFYPAQDGVTVTGRYYKRFADVATGMNALINRHPDLFVYAALVESGPMLGEMTRTPIWQAKYTELVQEANEQERRRMTRGSKLQTRVA